MNSHRTFTIKRNNQKWILISVLCIFLFTVTTFTLLELSQYHTGQPSVVKVILNSFRTGEEQGKTQQNQINSTANKFLLINLDQNDNKDQLLKTIVNKEESKLSDTEQARQVRDTEKEIEASKNSSSPALKSSYYEEQQPVVVYSKTEGEHDVPLSYKQYDNAAAKENDSIPPYDRYATETKDDGENNAPESKDYLSDDYYNPQSAQQYHLQYPPQYRPQYPPQYDDDSRENFPGPEDNSHEDFAAYQNKPRSSVQTQRPDYDSYYRQWHYASATTAPLGAARGPVQYSDTRKLQTMRRPAQQSQRDPYAGYMDDYDYGQQMSRNPQSQQAYRQQQMQYPTQNYQQQSAHSSAAGSNTALQQQPQRKEGQGQMNILSVIRTLKTMWDLYRSFASSWNTIAERRNREQELAEQKFKEQQKLRINSKKPGKMNNKTKPESADNKNKNNNNNRNKKKTTTTTTTTTTVAPGAAAAESSESDEDSKESVEVGEETVDVKKQEANKQSLDTNKKPVNVNKQPAKNLKPTPKAKVEPRKAAKGDKDLAAEAEGLREKRQTALQQRKDDVGEGRYIKGDPLKGYYDFVVTEGSYKFWAAFQVGTALLIIYSTFAAIYYSKVNPLVSDYDYTDYLGGARSMSGGDLDFVDDGDDETKPIENQNWSSWLPRSGHSLKFILDAIDKLPVDHDESKDNAKSNANVADETDFQDDEDDDTLIADDESMDDMAQENDYRKTGDQSDREDERLQENYNAQEDGKTQHNLRASEYEGAEEDEAVEGSAYEYNDREQKDDEAAQKDEISQDDDRAQEILQYHENVTNAEGEQKNDRAQDDESSKEYDTSEYDETTQKAHDNGRPLDDWLRTRTSEFDREKRNDLLNIAIDSLAM